ncbi:MAG: purine-nucleoside phosphorylase [Myxococcota bacterium]
MSQNDQIKEAVTYVKGQTTLEPRIAVVLGSGLGAFAEQVVDPVRIPYGQIPHFAVSSVTGHKGELVLGTIRDVPVAVMSGRMHFYEGHSLASVILPTRVLGGLGAQKFLVTNAAGGVNPDFGPGTLMAIVDHINLTGNNPLIGPNDSDVGPRFPDMSEAYSMEGRAALRAAADAVGVTLQEGVYCGVVGPSYETPAEIRMMQRIGADAVGMSTVPEVIIANHAGMKVAGLSLITNAAAGITDAKLSHDEVKEVADQSRDQLVSVLTETVARFA